MKTKTILFLLPALLISIKGFSQAGTLDPSLGDNGFVHTAFQVYPNPLSFSATIQFTLPNSSELKIELFDLQGRKIQTIAEKIFGAGNHQLNFSAGGLSKGMFFLRMQSETGISTQTIIIK
jgi:hypothetical protein